MIVPPEVNTKERFGKKAYSYILAAIKSKQGKS